MKTEFLIDKDNYFNTYDPDKKDPFWKATVKKIIGWQKTELEKNAIIESNVLKNYRKNVLFEFDKAVVQKGSFGALESIVNILNTKSELKISLKGHTDAQGSENYNVMLSKNRVSAVQDFLLSNGISAERIIIEAFGEKVPIADNSSSEGRKLNRRVEVRFIEK